MNCIKFLICLSIFSSANDIYGQNYKALADEARELYLNLEYEKAIPLYRNSIQKLKEKSDRKKKEKWLDDLHFLYHDLGISLLNTGRNEAAEQVLMKAFTYWEDIHFTAEDYKKATLLDLAGHLGELYVNLGLLDNAEKVLDIAYRKYSRAELELVYEHSDYHLAFDFFTYEFLKAIINLNRNDFESARRHITKQDRLYRSLNLNFDERLIGPIAFSTYTKILYNDRHDKFFKGHMGRWDGSTKNFYFRFAVNDEKNTLNYFTQKFGRSSKYHIKSIIALVRRELYNNKPDEAEALFNQYAKRVGDYDNVLPALRADLLLLEASINFRLGKLEKANQLFLQGIKLKENYYEKNLYFLSLEEQSKFWRIFKSDLNNFYEFTLTYLRTYPGKTRETLQTIVELQAENKGRILQSALLLKRMIYKKDKDSVLLNKYEALTRLKRQYANLTNPISSYNDHSSIQSRLESLQEQMTEKERELFSEIEIRQPFVSYDSIQKGLGEDEVLVETLRISTMNFFKVAVEKTSRSLIGGPNKRTAYENHEQDSVSYLTIFISKNEDPRYIIFKNVDSLENSSLKFYKNAMKYKIKDTVSYTAYMASIDSLTFDKKTVYFSPDGVYHLINPNSIWDKTTRKYLYEKKTFIKITNPGDILNKEVEYNSGEAIYLFGRPEFGQKRSSTNRSLFNMEASSFSDLPGTEEEVETIKELMHEKVPVFLHTKKEASEENIIKVSNPGFLHIATHGFFFPSNNVQNSEIDKMMRSGLLLSGVFNAQSTKTDGILTSLEASLINLQKTDLVVLSACETGKGEVNYGEGVYGLQRGFALAGAKHTLMSLWKVDDEATRDFMINFYDLFNTSKNVTEAYKQAMAKTKSTYEHPYYWGAFVLLKN